MARPPMVSVDGLVDRLAGLARSDGLARVLVPGGAMEPIALQEAFARRPERAAGLCFAGLPVPGVNRFDWTALHTAAAMEVGVPAADWAAGIQRGQIRVLSGHYSETARWLMRPGLAAQVVHLSPPGPDGLCAMGFSGDLQLEAGARQGTLIVGIINPEAPDVKGAARIAPDQCDLLCEAAAPLREAGPALAVPSALADEAAGLVPDGATLQIGIGRLPGAILATLAARRGLRIHSGLVGAELAALLDAGALAEGEGAVTAGLVLGDAGFYARMADEPRLQLVPVSVSHALAVMAAKPLFTAINAALEVDLSGQINCEFAGARRISGIGGALDFMRAARLSPGGQALSLIHAEGKDGQSRVVPRLTAPCVSVGRADADIVVTEHGSAALRWLDDACRADALTAIAAPSHRRALQASRGAP